MAETATTWRVALSCGCAVIVRDDPGQEGDGWTCHLHGVEEVADYITQETTTSGDPS